MSDMIADITLTHKSHPDLGDLRDVPVGPSDGFVDQGVGRAGESSHVGSSEPLHVGPRFVALGTILTPTLLSHI